MPNIRGLNTNPSSSMVAITPSDTVNINQTTRGIYVGGGGNISVVLQDSSVVLLVAVQTGSVLPIEVIRVNATNTTATNLVALF